jgi:hypothetical protein
MPNAKITVEKERYLIGREVDLGVRGNRSVGHLLEWET